MGSAEVLAASAVAFCRSTGVYAYASNCGTESEAKDRALRSARNRGARDASIIVSSNNPGYGAISFWRPAGQRIKGIGAYCGASTRAEAFFGAQNACRNNGCGPGPAPRVAWNDIASK